MHVKKIIGGDFLLSNGLRLFFYRAFTQGEKIL